MLLTLLKWSLFDIWKYFTDNDFTRLQEKQIKFTD